MRSIQKIALLLAVALILVSCGGGTPTSPTPPGPGGTPAWSTIDTPLVVTPRTVAPQGNWEGKVYVKVNQGGLSYESKWILRDSAGQETVLRTLTGSTQHTGNASGWSNGEWAPSQRGSYKVIWRFTESNGTVSNTISSEADLIVQ